MREQRAARHRLPVPLGGQLPGAPPGQAAAVDESVLALLMGALVAQLRLVVPAGPGDLGTAAPARGTLGDTDKAAFSVAEAAEMLGISRALAYDLVRSGELASVRLGRRIVVPRLVLERLLERATEGRYVQVGSTLLLERASPDATTG